MVRKQKPKEEQGLDLLAQAEKETEEYIKNLDDTRKKEFKEEMTASYYFSVAFNTSEERDEWLRKQGLYNKLIEEYFIKASDLPDKFK